MKRAGIIACCLVLVATTGFSQKLWSIRGSWISSANTLAKNDYNAEKYKTPNSFMVGFTHGNFDVGTYGWYGMQYGVAFRNLNMKSRTSTTVFNISWVEVPVDFAFAANLFGFLPIGMHGGLYITVPVKYKGSIDRYNQPKYAYGNQTYERPFVMAGLRGGFNCSIKTTKKSAITAFVSYSASIMALAKPAGDAVTVEYKIPLPVFAEFGLSYMFGKDEIERPFGR